MVKPSEIFVLLGYSLFAQRHIMLPRHSVDPCMQWTVSLSSTFPIYDRRKSTLLAMFSIVGTTRS